MKKRYQFYAAVGFLACCMAAPVCTGQAEEEALVISEDVAEETPEENPKEQPEAEEQDGFLIESVDVVSTKEPSKEEKKIVNALEAEARKREEKQREEAAKNNPIPEFHVNPLDYPPANITENTRQIYEYLTGELGLNHAAACGVLGNIHLESSFFPLALGDGGTSYGICQWHLGRFSGLIAYCNENGLDYNTLEGQLDYMKYELETGYSGVFSYIKSVPDTQQGAYDAAYYWCIGYELPNDMYYRGAQRGNLAANEYYTRDFSQEEPAAEGAGNPGGPLLTIDSNAAGFYLPAVNLEVLSEEVVSEEIASKEMLFDKVLSDKVPSEEVLPEEAPSETVSETVNER